LRCIHQAGGAGERAFYASAAVMPAAAAAAPCRRQIILAQRDQWRGAGGVAGACQSHRRPHRPTLEKQFVCARPTRKDNI